MRLKLIACEILYREFCAAVARSTNQVDVEFLPKGLHDIGQARMSARLKEVLDQINESADESAGESPYDAILLGYGLCSNGLLGLEAKTIPLVVPRAHDCITLLLGDKQRYLEYFQNHPGVYYKSSGWIERGDGLTQFDRDSITQETGMNQTYEQLVAKYGEDNAKFLYEQLCDLTHNYRGLTFIEMGIEPDDRFQREAQQIAAERGWEFEKLQGDMAIIQDLVDGPWDAERFLVVPPGSRVASSFDEEIIRAEQQ